MNDNSGTSETVEKRVATRHKITLGASVLVTAVKNGVDEEYTILQAKLLDVSISGLALIIAYNDMLELNRLGAEIKLQLLLPLPSGAIELEAIPMRYQKLDATEKSKVLLGARITNMSGRDRIVFMDFIHGL